MTSVFSNKMKAQHPKSNTLPNERRKNYVCRIRCFVFDAFKNEAKRLNCSNGVYLEALLIKALEVNLVTQDDVLEYNEEKQNTKPSKLLLRDRYVALLGESMKVKDSVTKEE